MQLSYLSIAHRRRNNKGTKKKSNEFMKKVDKIKRKRRTFRGFFSTCSTPMHVGEKIRTSLDLHDHFAN
jgi:hypothetical protein